MRLTVRRVVETVRPVQDPGSWAIGFTFPRDVELFGIEKIGGVNCFINQKVRRLPYLRTSFSKNTPLFALLLLPQLLPHKYLYDTAWARGVNSQLAENRGVGKGSYAQVRLRVRRTEPSCGRELCEDILRFKECHGQRSDSKVRSLLLDEIEIHVRGKL